MKLSEYFDTELKSTIVHVILGVIAGYASFLSNATSIGFLSALVGLGIGYAFSLQYLKWEMKKWYGSAFVLFVAWLIVWTLFYNVGIR